MKAILGNGRSNGFVLIWVNESGTVQSTTFFTEPEARWLHSELGRQLRVFCVAEENERLRSQLNIERRRVASLRGRLNRKRAAR